MTVLSFSGKKMAKLLMEEHSHAVDMIMKYEVIQEGVNLVKIADLLNLFFYILLIQKELLFQSYLRINLNHFIIHLKSKTWPVL